MIRNIVFSVFFFIGIIFISLLFLPSFFFPQKVVIFGGKLMGYWTGFCLKYFLSQISFDGGPKLSFSEKALVKMRSYSWPGNVRQLKNIIISFIATHRG